MGGLLAKLPVSPAVARRDSSGGGKNSETGNIQGSEIDCN
jgi:hypothetical protein